LIGRRPGGRSIFGPGFDRGPRRVAAGAPVDEVLQSGLKLD
jgi:hypothetical protein